MLYESEGRPGESFVGALRYVRREGKAAILEQRLVEASTGRAVARAWALQLLVQDGTVIDWPDVYFSRVAEIDGREIPIVPRRPDAPWGPPVEPSRRRPKETVQAPSSVEDARRAASTARGTAAS